ncbi:unnamed protein product [Boreogadus saida]
MLCVTWLQNQLAAYCLSVGRRKPSQQLAKNGHLSSLWTRGRLTGAKRAGAMWRKSSAALRRLQGRRPEVTAISPTGCSITIPCVTGPGLLTEREASRQT